MRTRGAVRTSGRSGEAKPAITVDPIGPIKPDYLDIDEASRTMIVRFQRLKEPWLALLLGDVKKRDRGISARWQNVLDGQHILLTEPVAL
jgi:hypothetical protein